MLRVVVAISKPYCQTSLFFCLPMEQKLTLRVCNMWLASPSLAKCQDNLRPVIYYLKHLLQDMDETQMLSRALISYVRLLLQGCWFL